MAEVLGLALSVCEVAANASYPLEMRCQAPKIFETTNEDLPLASHFRCHAPHISTSQHRRVFLRQPHRNLPLLAPTATSPSDTLDEQESGLLQGVALLRWEKGIDNGWLTRQDSTLRCVKIVMRAKGP